MFASDALEVITTAIDNAMRQEAGHVLGIHWTDDDDPALGAVAEAWSTTRLDFGPPVLPTGWIMTPAAVDKLSDSDLTVDLDGTGLATHPLGQARLRHVRLGGEPGRPGHGASMIGLEGTGLTTSPLDCHAAQLVHPGLGADLPGLHLGHGPLLEEPTLDAPSGSHLRQRVRSGGWRTPSGYGVGRALESKAVQARSGVVYTAAGPPLEVTD